MRGYIRNPYTALDSFLQEAVTGHNDVVSGNVTDAIGVTHSIRAPSGMRQMPVGNIIDEQHLTPFSSADLPVDDPRIVRRIPQAGYTPGQYGDMIVIPVNIVAGTDLLALPRPTKTRIHLLIQNTLAANVLYYTFDNPASTINGIQIQPGGNAFYDQVVPQNDLHLFASVSGIILLAYINVDIENGIP